MTAFNFALAILALIALGCGALVWISLFIIEEEDVQE